MASARPGLGFASLIFLAGALLLMFFILLAGVKETNPLYKFYFLEADTSAISGAPATSRWTLWNVCGVDSSGHNADCGAVKPAYPFQPMENFGTSVGVPAAFTGHTHNKYWWMSRFLFAFYLIALFFGVVALFTGLLALCSRLGGAIGGLMTMVALFFDAIVAALMTACFVKGRDVFTSNNQTAHLGKYAFGFTWASVACLLLSTLLFFFTCALGRKDSTYTRRSGGRSFFSRKRSTRSRGSFIDSESQRRVKDEYA